MEVRMSTQTRSENRAPAASARTVETKLEVVVIPVSDVERAKRFYGGLGWRLDADFTNGPDWRVVQMTPPGSQTSVQFGKGITTAAPGSVKGTFLVVEDIEAARAEIIGKGADVSEPFHFASIGGPRLPGVDPERRTYNTRATFSDPDGNTWLLQEITTRLPGRGFSGLDVATLTGLLREAETRHGAYEKAAPKHHWSDWYAAYIVARERGRTPEEAVKDAGLHMESAPR
jgi:catechol 2,3-dioxygenase-like lactoylglutathione lyase family enzyme